MLISLTAMKFISLTQDLWDTSVIILILLAFIEYLFSISCSCGMK